MTRYFMTIPEAVNLVIHAACLTTGDDLFMLRMGEVVRIVELAERIIRLRGLRPYKDIPIEFTGIRPGEKLHEELSSSAESAIPTIHPYIVQLQSRRNGIQPIPFSDRINALFQYGLNDTHPVLDQLRDVITLGENQIVEHAH
jgi:FlaA1/EpsC-like NDP-sugar epimerase